MGLAGPKRRSKIAHDPNNNNWAKSTDSFGHKILASQGWKPGDTLGAKDANHSSHYTAGSNSHIRVLLKDNNLGLGAALAGNNAETFGLSLYSGILGRLNGKSEVQLEKEQTAQRDVELALYQGRKFGQINFISAGYLVGDKIELRSTVLPDPKSSQKPSAKATASVAVASDTAAMAGKKRKRAEPQNVVADVSSSDSDSSESDEPEVSRKSRKVKDSKKKKSKKASTKESSGESADDSKSKDKKGRKDKKEKKNKATGTTSSEDETRAEKKLRKAERRARKEERRRRKEAKKTSASASATPSTAPTTPAEPAQPSASPAPFLGRHSVRQRYIAQKRLAHMDPQALKEIFMVKAA